MYNSDADRRSRTAVRNFVAELFGKPATADQPPRSRPNQTRGFAT